jgi:hypothetical protein
MNVPYSLAGTTGQPSQHVIQISVSSSSPGLGKKISSYDDNALQAALRSFRNMYLPSSFQLHTC